MKSLTMLVLLLSVTCNIMLGANVRDNQIKLQESQLELKLTQEELAKTYSKVSEMEQKYNALVEEHKKATQTLSRGGEVKVLNMEMTAYTHTGKATRSGVMPKVGVTIAVDPKIIPLGTRVYIEGIGYRIAQDTGGLIKGHIIDLFMDSESQCEEFGRQKNKKVYILK